LAIAGLLSPAFALAAEPSGCDQFKWPIAHEQSALLAPQAARLDSGATLAFDAAANVHLAPAADAKLEMPPERASKASPSFAGLLKLGAPSAAGIFKVTLSDEGWIDVIQDGRFLKPVGFTGATDCQGVRKSVKFAFEAKPLTVQLSGVKAAEISVIVSPE
jgi:hypothetical protein